MTKIGVISDVHGDLHALHDALRHFKRLGVRRVICCGDIVDYGLFPDETIALLKAEGVESILGNHDRWNIGSSLMGSSTLTKESRRFLKSLPVKLDLVIDGVRVAVRHGNNKSDMESIHPDHTTMSDLRRELEEAEADVMLVGHSHLRLRLRVAEKKWVLSPGALLRSPAEDLEASGIPTPGTFGVLDLPEVKFTVYRAADGAEVKAIERVKE